MKLEDMNGFEAEFWKAVKEGWEHCLQFADIHAEVTNGLCLSGTEAQSATSFVVATAPHDLSISNTENVSSLANYGPKSRPYVHLEKSIRDSGIALLIEGNCFRRGGFSRRLSLKPVAWQCHTV
jgi:hypothetical protein